MTLLLGIDLGTSYFKVGLFDESGALRGLGRVAVSARAPQPGRVELAVETFWELLRRGLATALAEAGATAGQIAGVAYSAQANTFLLLDARDAALTPLVLWTDTRATELGDSWRQFTLTEEFGRMAGFTGSSANAAAAKWRWFQKHQPEVWARTRSVMTVSDYFTFALTGERVGDAGTAALLGTFDLHAQAWWPEALAHYALADKQLSRPLRPGSPAGKTTAAATQLLGLPAGLPFAVGSLDHHVAALGSGVGSVADAGISTGTVLAAIALTGKVRPQVRCYHGLHFTGAGFFRLVFDPAGAGQLEEFQQKFAPDRSVDQLIALAEKSPAGARPVHLPRAGDSEEDQAIFTRFILERIAFDQRRLLQRLQDDAPVRSVVASGGAARSSVWLQIKADLLGIPVRSQVAPESACLGAAMLASVAAGVHANLPAAARTMGHAGREYLPDPARATVYRDWLPELPGV